MSSAHLLLPAVLAGLFSGALAAPVVTAAPVQPLIESRVAPILEIDGLRFRDLNKNGVLDAYEDWRLPTERRVEDLIGRMTVEEKAGLMMFASHSGFFGPGGTILEKLAPPPPGALKSPVNVTGVPGFDRSDKPSPRTLLLDYHVRWLGVSSGGTPVEAATWANNIQAMAEQDRLGIPVVLASDPVHTTNRLPGGALPPPDRKKITSSWPDQIGLAATADPALVEQFGKISAKEFRALGYHMVLNPIVDLSTEPRWNRIPGTFGEDVDLSTKLVTAYIRGSQGPSIGPDSVLTSAKHFPGDGPVNHGLDPHNVYGQKLVYPAGLLDLHLKPFQAAIGANVATIMGTYGIVTAVDDTVGANFSKPVMTGLLRDKLHFKGIALSDWLHAMPWGVEDLDWEERELRMIDAGLDQFGGEHDPSHIIALVKERKVSVARLDVSMRRILMPMFEMGLFEDPYVDPQEAGRVVASPEFVAAGKIAQRKAIVLLKNAGAMLPLKAGARVQLIGFDAAPDALAGRVVKRAADADVVVVKVNAPYTANKTTETFFKGTHEGPLVFNGADNQSDLEAIQAAAATGKPVVVVISMERPAVLSEFIGQVAGVLATFGSDDAAVADILTGAAKPQGRLPFDLPADEASVEAQAEDKPFDFEHVLFHHGYGLQYAP